MAEHHVLIVEDEEKQALLVQDYLKASGFEATIISDGGDVIPFVKNNQLSLMVLDINLPNKNGIEICQEVREFSQLPVLMITARIEEADRLKGLQVGADDYLCKPFSPREMVARVESLIRRSVQPAFKPINDYFFDATNLTVTINGISMSLTQIEYRLLNLLASQIGQSFDRQTISATLYDDQRVVSNRTIDSHIKKLRKKLFDLTNVDLIQSIYGVGYRLQPLASPVSKSTDSNQQIQINNSADKTQS
ncbi:response regulator [Aliikangiella coralliicola]|uniref:Response regulator n=1 Tax=Aliikangiella coralliicola TaxID=2592383 RepID=A0A545UB34_9GAMM|nr:response regulator [Aliikangiella coralliicola]TQV86682.1 response regulator [Aliikangiella coralliicola]